MLTQATLTGGFCIVFAFVVEMVTDALPPPVYLGLAFVSGFLGSLFAQTALRRGSLPPGLPPSRGRDEPE